MSINGGLYSSQSAVARAGIYFATCWVIAVALGVTADVFSQAVATSDQLGDWTWWLFTVACVAVIIVAYGVIWPMGTVIHGRARHVPVVIGFGVMWGLAQGQLYLSMWELTARLVDNSALDSAPVVGAVSFVAISAFTGVWHDQYWDRKVSPPHNIEEWNAKKVAFCHVPNLVITLTYFATHGNAAIFVALQTLALTLSTWFMRFPPRNAVLDQST